MKALKQVILIRTDLKLPKGKAASQAAHASVLAVLSASKSDVNHWVEQGMPKIVLGVDNADMLESLLLKAKNDGLITSIVEDDGLTSVIAGTITCGVIGPNIKESVDLITSSLKLYS